MSEQESERWALTTYASNSPARVQVAGRQLAIAAQLKQDIDRKRLVALLKRISYEEIVLFLTIRQALDGNLMERFADHLYWGGDDRDYPGLSGNSSLPWSPELIERFADRWDYWELSRNTSLPWSIELIERVADRWVWGSLSNNESLPWSVDLLDRFADRWDWLVLSSNSSLPWSLRAYSSRRVARQVMMPHAKCSMAKKVSGNFSHRTKIRRKRFIQL